MWRTTRTGTTEIRRLAAGSEQVSDSAYDTAQLQRAVTLTLTELPIALRIASAEDTMLTKLEWYRIKPSDKQWEAVQTMFRVQQAALDTVYLATWARLLRITNRLSRAQRGERPPHHAVPEPQQHGRDSA